jgi:hypothetical protein
MVDSVLFAREELDDVESEMAGLLMTEKPKAIPVKLHADVVKLARIAAAYRGGTMTNLLSDYLRPILTKIVEEEASKQMKHPKGEGGPK